MTSFTTRTSRQLRLALVAAAALALPMAHAAAISKADYKDGKDRISATYKADKAACAPLAGNAKDICIATAKGRDKVSSAELEYAYSAKPKDQNKIGVAQAEAAYAVAAETCDDLAGNAKDVCVKQAKAQRTKALADAKVGRVVGEVTRDAAQDKRDADYKVAAEKCDALAGDTKSACVSAAKARFGKT
jgi:hypothetical protein